ncbi:type I-A CRISPR-associated protein Cas5a [Stygiolobus caldivivus]|uniref:CRISPR-associated protein Cas5 n=1 Tax=Stygiolobus caldivivus TaxID=2824673 RepID=A0A8D5U680_9CREN|nr:type I-A CRISPR-associated protein Cas5a [Stygiolobus caldivivus]BCU69773.1 hypothetical protein KN1_10700 [Stygiolobus caldivivus]
MRALIASFRAPFFSIRVPETYQVAVTYSFLMPSTLFGSICASLCVLNGWSEQECREKLRGTKVRESYNGLIYSTKFPVILRRTRKVLEEGKLPETLDEFKGFSDAMVREYAYSLDERKVVVVSHGIDALKEALRLVNRVGDSESLVAVVDLREVELEECGSGEINVMSKVGAGGDVIKGFDEEGKPSTFYVPVKAFPWYLIYSPVKYKGRVLCGGGIKVPAEGEW